MKDEERRRREGGRKDEEGRELGENTNEKKRGDRGTEDYMYRGEGRRNEYRSKRR